MADGRGAPEPVYVDQFRGRLFLVPRSVAPEPRELAAEAEAIGHAVSAALVLAWTRRAPVVALPDQLRATEESRRYAREVFAKLIGLPLHEYRPEVRVNVWDNGRDTIRIRRVGRNGSVAKDSEVSLGRAVDPTVLGEWIVALIRDAHPSRGTLARAYGAPEARASVYSRLGVAYVCSTRVSRAAGQSFDYAPPYARIDLRAEHAPDDLAASTVAALDASELVDPGAADKRERWGSDFVESTGLARRTIFSPRTGLVSVGRCGPEIRISPTRRGRGQRYIGLPDREVSLLEPPVDELGAALEDAIRSAL
ncbi:MAG TPA: hypothetical protein VH914_13525 [Acidimicrobiia bacterium]|jgi:hypothetical protein|nr:hypothetical protein [Acidimicrobiia bacterium]